MFRKMALTVCLIAGCVWCLALATRADSAQPAAAGASFKSVASVHALMYGQKTFFKQIRAALKNPSFPERTETIEEAAEVLAELANINATKNDKADYRAWAAKLRDTALELSHEADKDKAADEEAMTKLVGEMGETCGACHDMYQ